MAADVLDPGQLKRIQATHRGFLYQHLFAVGCILKLHGRAAGEVRIERDEDVEVETNSVVHYAQVKNLSRNLVFSDIASALNRFAELRGTSQGDKQFQFHIISSSEPGPDLAIRTALGDWPGDVKLHTPERRHALPEFLKVCEDVEGMLEACESLAAELPFRSLEPRTLVWKLAARVQFAATGVDREHPQHAFRREELHDLFELLVRQLQDFVAVPDDYRVQKDEPELASSQSVRLIVGFSGAGKTVWASRKARHSAAPTAYFDLNMLSGGAVANSIARELAARFLTGLEDGSAILPAGSGLEMLRVVCARPELSEGSILVLDNVQRAHTNVLRSILQACAPIQVVCLAQPWAGQSEIAAQFGLEIEKLHGWDADTVAAEFDAEGVTISPGQAKRWRKITGGLPLYVRSAAALCKSEFEGEAGLGLDAVSDQTHVTELVQEVLLERGLAALPDQDRQLVAALSLSLLPLTMSEIGTLVQNTDLSSIPQRAVLRGLLRRGFVEMSAGGAWKVHDALVVLGQGIAETFPSDLVLQLRCNLRDLLFEALQGRRDLARLAAWMRLLGPTGRADILADMAGSEMFHEIGDPSDLKDVLRDAAFDKSSEPALRFWALDALVFWEMQEDQHVRNPEPALRQLELLVQAEDGFGFRERAAVAMKRMLLHGMNGDARAVEDVFEALSEEMVADQVMYLIVRYNRATALFLAGQHRRCLAAAAELASEYFDMLSLDPVAMIGTNPAQLRAMLPCHPREIQDELKRLADTMELIARTKRALSLPPVPESFHAAKLYQEAGAYKSQMKVSQDITDDMVALGDYEGALEMMENNVIPILSTFELNAHVLDVRGQYAVLLAYNAQANSARAEIDAIRPYVPGLPNDYQSGFANQCTMIEDLLQRSRRRPTIASPFPVIAAKQKIGRNEPCPCGSGKKFKRCCGRH